MPSASYDIEIEKGATFSLVLTWKDENGSPIDLTGYSAKMQVRSSPTATDVITEFSTTNARIALGGSAGTITLSMTAADTAAITKTKGVYDLELISGSTVTRLLEGSILFDAAVTHD